MFELVIGKNSVENTDYLIKKIGENINHENIIFMVPDQFTLEAERQLIKKLNLCGLFNIQVFSFRRLISRLVDELGGGAVKQLDKTSKAIFVSRLLKDYANELKMYNRFSNDAQFSFELSKIITECKQFDVSVAWLEAQLEAVDDTKLKNKLYDIIQIYKAYDMHKQGYVDNEDVINSVIENVNRSNILKNAKIYIDGFDVFTNQAYELIGKMTSVVNNITISFCMDKDCETSLFYMTQNSYKEIENIGITTGKPIKTTDLNQLGNEELPLQKLALQVFSYDNTPIENIDSHVELFGFSDLVCEIDYVCSKVIELKNQGQNFYDMAIICNDLSSYGRILEQCFLDNDIPCYIDEKYPLVAHSFTQFVLNAIKASKNHEKTNLIAMMKLGYLPVGDDDVELFENYVLKYGVDYNKFTKPFVYDEKIEDIRKTVMKQLAGLNITKLTSCGDMAKKIKEFIESLDINKSDTEENIVENELFTQVYDKVVELLDTISNIFSSQDMTSEEFIQMFEVGLNAIEIGTLPQMSDQVLIGDVSRTKLHDVKSLFIIGCVESSIPHTIKRETLLSDDQRQKIKALGKAIGRDSSDINSLEKLLTYKTMSKPADYLWISYPCVSISGSEQFESMIFGRIKDIAPNIILQKNIPWSKKMQEQLTFSKKIAVKKLIEVMNTQEGEEFALGVYSYLKNNEPELLNAALNPKIYESKMTLNPNIAQQLYGENKIGVTRIERYFGCPFSQFVNSGLKPIPRENYEIERMDIGGLLHNVIDIFTKDLMKKGVDLNTLEKDTATTILGDILKDVLPKHNNGIFYENNLNKFMGDRVATIANNAIWGIISRLKSDGYHVLTSEMAFGLEGGLPPITIELKNGRTASITGKVDRIDVNENGAVRVIDYKTSGKDIKFNDIYYGLKLQLLVYMDKAIECANEKYGGSYPSGLLYMRLNDTFKGENDYETLVKKAQENVADLLKVNSIELSESSVKIKENQLTKDQLETVISFGKLRAKQAVGEILEGKIDVNPLIIGNNSPCDYCKFTSVCGYDTTCKRYGKSMKKEEFFDIIKKEEKDNGMV